MAGKYYIIELPLKWLILLLLGMALLMVLAFGGGYGAAWSVFRAQGYAPEELVSAMEMPAEEISTETQPKVILSEATPIVPQPTVSPGVSPAQVGPSPTPVKKAVAIPEAVPTNVAGRTGQGAPQPGLTAEKAGVAPRAKPVSPVFLVQVLASGHVAAIEKARKQLVEIGFPNDHHRVVESRLAGGGVLLKLRVGPFPDHVSAQRVKMRLQHKGFPDAWVVVP